MIVDSQVDKRGVGARPLLAVAALVGVGVLAFVAGRASAPEPAVESVATVPTTAPAVQTLEASLGPATIVSDVVFSSGQRVLLICSETVDGTAFEYVQAMDTGDENTPELLGERTVLAGTDAGPDCDSCVYDVSDTTDTVDPVIYGDCRTGGMNGERTLFAVAGPKDSGRSGLALVIECGIGELLPGDQSLILRSQSSRVGDTHTALGFPDIELIRDGASFVPDDLEVLQHYCISERSGQLDASRRVDKQARTQLSYEQTESDVGAVGVHGSLLIGLDETSCSALRTAYWENLSAGSPNPKPIESVTGLPAPAGVLDWYIECQYP